MKRIGIISDTHGTFDDTLREFLKDVDEIWHAGDIGSIELADRIAAFVSQTSLRSRRSASMTAASSPSVSLTRARPVPRRPMRSPICSNAGGSAASCRRRSAGLGMCTTAEPDLPSVYSRRT